MNDRRVLEHSALHADHGWRCSCGKAGFGSFTRHIEAVRAKHPSGRK